MATKAKKKGNIVSVDFSGVEVGGSVVPEGKYEVNVVEVEQKTSESSGGDYLSWELEITSPEKYKGKTLYYNTSLQQKALWNLRGLLETLGVETPDDAMDLDLDDLIDRTAGCTVVHEPYNGKTTARVVEFFEVTEGVEDDVVEEPKPKKKVKEEPAEEAASDEDDEAAKRKARREARKARRAGKEEEPAEEEAAPKKVDKKKAKSKTYTSDGILEKDEDELAELVDEHELDVALDDFNTLRRKRAAVVEALDEKGLIED